MAYEAKDLSGVLFKNEKKTQDTHPDYTGSALIEGVNYFMDAWIKTSTTNGNKFMSFRFKPKNKQPGMAQDLKDRARARAPQESPFEDDAGLEDPPF